MVCNIHITSRVKGQINGLPELSHTNSSFAKPTDEFQISVKHLYPVIVTVTDKERVILTQCNAPGLIKLSCPTTITTNCFH